MVQPVAAWPLARTEHHGEGMGMGGCLPHVDRKGREVARLRIKYNS